MHAESGWSGDAVALKDPMEWLKEHYADTPLVLFAIEQNAEFKMSFDELTGLLKAYALSQCTCERRRRERLVRRCKKCKSPLDMDKTCPKCDRAMWESLAKSLKKN